MITKHDADLALQKAIFARLTSAMPTSRIYDIAPAGAVLPYIIVGETYGHDDSAKNLESEVVVATIHIFDKSQGLKTVKELRCTLITAITSSRLDLTPDGYYMSDVGVEYKSAYRESDDDGETNHAVVRFRFEIQKQ
jgi:hypothetical protein